MEEARKFWMIFRLGGMSPSKVHPSKNEAIDESRRLARQYPGKKVFVLEAVSAFCVSPDPVVEIKVK